MRTRGATCAFLAIQSRLSSKPHSFSATYGVLSAADSSASSHTGESVRKILVLDPACSNFDVREQPKHIATIQIAILYMIPLKIVTIADLVYKPTENWRA